MQYETLVTIKSDAKNEIRHTTYIPQDFKYQLNRAAYIIGPFIHDKIVYTFRMPNVRMFLYHTYSQFLNREILLRCFSKKEK